MIQPLFIKIGSRTLASYSYSNDRNYYLSALDYGNGDRVQYSYDKFGRLEKQTYEDGDTVSCRYDNSGGLARVTDSATGRTTTYYYDFTDRLMKYAETGTGYSHTVGYEYDGDNNLTALVDTIGATARTTAYAYDTDNRVTSVSSGDSSKTYGYDGFGRLSQRVTKHSGNTVLTERYEYYSPTTARTSSRVEKLTLDAAQDVVYDYAYDGGGNITSVSDGSNTTSYVYDSANQLTRENNQAAGKTWVWTYDDAGNILTRTEYPYSPDTLGEVQDTVTYTYGDSAWGDLLTDYDGQAITCDTIGNPLSDGTWAYTWEHGRQLAISCPGPFGPGQFILFVTQRQYSHGK